MATALTSQLTRFTDRCNKVLAGGTVKTFEPNSLIPKITYQDPNKEIPNLEEVILDETGRAKIYISGDYRIQIYSRDGILIEDNLLVEQTLVQRDFVELSQEIQTELQQALDQFQIESTAAVDNLYAAITSIGGMVVDGQFKLDWAHVFNRPTTVVGYGITDAYTKSEANTTFIENSEKAVASGVATLAANSKIPVEQLPAATEAAVGAAKIATSAIAQAGANDTDIMTPLKVKGVSLGHGQTRKDVLASRLANTIYTNPDNTPIFITLGCTGSNLNQTRTYTVGGRTTAWLLAGSSIGTASTVEFMVLPNESYSVNIKPEVWWEISK